MIFRNILILIIIGQTFFCKANEQIFNKIDSLTRVKNFTEAQDLLEKIKPHLNNEDLKKYYYFKTICFVDMNKPKKALEMAYKGLALFSSDDFSLQKARFYDEISTIHRLNQADLDLVLSLIDESLYIKENLTPIDTSILIGGYIRKANAYNSFIDRVDCVQDSALYYYDKAEKLCTEKHERLLLMCQNSRAKIFLDKGQHKEATKITLKLLAYARKHNQKEREIPALVDLVYCYLKSGELIKAQKTLTELNPILEDENWAIYKGSLLEAKAQLKFLQKDYEEAYNDLVTFVNYKISTYNEELFHAQELYKSEQYKTQLERDHSKLLKAEVELKQNQFWIILLIIGLITLGMVALAINLFQRYKTKLITAELNNTKIESELKVIQAKLEGEQEERKVISALLHDQVASLLTAAGIHLKIAKTKNENPESIEKANAILKDVNTQVRNISHQLVSPVLMKFGLETAIDSLAQKLSHPNLNISFNSNFNNKRIDSKIETFLFQSCSEFLNNILKHSQATESSITLIENENRLSLIVNDNGIGIKEDKNQNVGLGLSLIRQRAEALKGKLIIESEGNGSYIKISLPISNSEAQPQKPQMEFSA